MRSEAERHTVDSDLQAVGGLNPSVGRADFDVGLPLSNRLDGSGRCPHLLELDLVGVPVWLRVRRPLLKVGVANQDKTSALVVGLDR